MIPGPPPTHPVDPPPPPPPPPQHPHTSIAPVAAMTVPAMPHRRSRRRLIVVVGALVVLVGAAIAGGVVLTGRHAALATPVPSASTRAHASASPTPVEGEGITEFGDGPVRFHVVFMAGAGEMVHTYPERGEQILGAEWFAEKDANNGEVLSTLSFPPDYPFDGAPAFLDGDVRFVVSTDHATLVSETAGTFAGFPSVDAVLSVPATAGSDAGFSKLRFILAGHTEFRLFAYGPANPPVQFTQFSTSLRILTHAP